MPSGSPGPVLITDHPRGVRRPAPALITLAVVVLVVAGIGFAVTAGETAVRLLPRKFTSAQQQQIMNWQVASRWREMPAGTIFTGSVTYQPPAMLDGSGSSLSLTARRVGIAPQASCSAATDPAAASVLVRNGCEAVLRATYTDGTDSYVATVGVAAFPGAGQAAAAKRQLNDIKHAASGLAPGVRTVTFAGTPAAGFTDGRRQLTGSTSDGSYVVIYTIGYSDDRPKVPVAADSYADGEMTSMGVGVAESVASVLDVPPPLPSCPGSPGC